MANVLNTLKAAANAIGVVPKDASASTADHEAEAAASMTSMEAKQLLARKEADLTLAAELGKALLERNEELRLQNDTLDQEYSERIEQLEQDRHRLRLQIEVMEDEYEQRVADLKADLASLRQQLTEVNDQKKEDQKERSLLISTLTEQNQRLTSQLSTSTKAEVSLRKEIQELRDRFDDKRLTIRDQVTHLETLREEIELVTSRKEDLERRIGQMVGERQDLSCNLDERSDRILILEKQTREQEAQLKLRQREMIELQETNQALTERIESMSRAMHSSIGSGAGQQMSLLNELEMSFSSSDWNCGNRSLRRPQVSRPDQIDEADEDEAEMEEDAEFDDSQMTCLGSEEMKELREEVVHVYQQLCQMAGQLKESEDNHNKSLTKKRRRHSNDSLITNSSCDSSGRGTSSSCDLTEDGGSSCDTSPVVKVKVGLLSEAVANLKDLLSDKLLCNSSKPCHHLDKTTMEDSAIAIEDSITDLRQAKVTMKQQDDEITELQSKLSVMEVTLRGVEEERDNLRSDLANSNLSKDLVIKKAWETRDTAVKRKNAAEVDLAKQRIAIMQINSQLMEAIQQKVELSQQLEDWKTDMEQLLEEQIRDRLIDSERRAVKRKPTSDQANMAATTSRSFFGFFQR